MLSENAQAWIETAKAKQARKESLYESEQVIIELADALDASHRTLRDEFAGRAMEGMLAGISGSEYMDEYDGDEKLFGEHQHALGKTAYSYADALLTAREREVKS
jgi:hypothetical protein